MNYSIGQVLLMEDTSEVGCYSGSLDISPEHPEADVLLAAKLSKAVHFLRMEAEKKPCRVSGFYCFIRFPDGSEDDLDAYFNADEYKFLVGDALREIKI